MKRRILVVGLGWLLTNLLVLSLAARNNFGLGAIIGEPSGISAKLWLDNKQAIDGALSFSFGEHSEFSFHSDYLWHRSDQFEVEQGKLLLYYGLGARIKSADNFRLGIRAPAGLNYIFATAPLDIFLEIAPVLDLINKTEFRLTGALGARYFFFLYIK